MHLFNSIGLIYNLQSTRELDMIIVERISTAVNTCFVCDHQLFYFAILCGAYYAVVTTSFEYIPGYYISGAHK
jgi:hypothetical protein